MADFWANDPVENQSGQFWANDPVSKSTGPSAGEIALDVAKQIPSGLVSGVAALPTTAPILTGLIGRGVQAGFDKFAPGFSDPTTVANEATLRDLAAQVRNKTGIDKFLPQPTTEPGKAIRSIGEFIPSAAGVGGSMARNLTGAAGAGLGSYGGETLAPDNPYVQLGGALVGGTAGLRAAEGVANKVAKATTPAFEDIGKVAGGQYQAIQGRAFDQPINPRELDAVAASLKGKLDVNGPRESVAPGIHRAIDEIKTEAVPGMADVADLVAARQNIKGFFDNPMPDPNKAGARKVLPLLDAEIERLSPGTAKLLREADANYSAAKTAERLDKRVARAELTSEAANSGLNLGNRLRQNAASMLLSNKESRGLSADEKSALGQLVKGTLAQNTLRMGSNLLGGGGGLGSTLLGLAAGGVGYETGHPELALAPIAGIGLRVLGNRSIANQAANVSAAIRARSPYAQQLGVKSPPIRLSDRDAALLSALVARPELGGLLSGTSLGR